MPSSARRASARATTACAVAARARCCPRAARAVRAARVCAARVRAGGARSRRYGFAPGAALLACAAPLACAALAGLGGCGADTPRPRCNEPGAPACPVGTVCAPVDADGRHACVPRCERADASYPLFHFYCADGAHCVQSGAYEPYCHPGGSVPLGAPCRHPLDCERGAHCYFAARPDPVAPLNDRSICYPTCNPLASSTSCPDDLLCTSFGCYPRWSFDVPDAG